MLSEVLLAAGVILILRFLLCDLLPLVYYFYVFFFSKTIDFKKYGKWAVVTGATDGIGKAYSEQLAKRGMNVVLVSRTLSKLEEVARELREKYSIETKLIAVDFSNSDIYDVLSTELSELDIGILVNNVGMSYDYPMFFHELPTEKVGAIVSVNTLSVAEMTHIVLPRMMEKKKGIIVNIGSIAGYDTLPLLSEYSGTKAFVHFFTRGIQCENRRMKSIILQYVAPSMVATKMSKLRPSMFCPATSSFVSSALRSVGKLPVTTGCFTHEVQRFLTDLLPKFISISITEKVLRSMKARALKKIAKQKAQ